MEENEENWSTVVNTKKIKSLERREERRKMKLEYERLKQEEEMLARGEVPEESEDDEETTPITIGADFNEIVRVQEKKEKELKKQAASTKATNKQKKEGTSVKLQSARALSAKVSNETWKSELQSFSNKFPTAQDIQLKYLADFFLETFNNCSEQRPSAKVLDKDVIETIREWLSSFPQKELNQFLVFIIEHELDSAQKNSPGIAILVDLFCTYFPSFFKQHKVLAAFKKKFGSGIPNKSYPFIHQIVWSTLHSSEPHVGLYFFMEFLAKSISKGTSSHVEEIVKLLESFKKIKLNTPFHSPLGFKSILQSCENPQIPPESRDRIIQMIGPLIELLDTDSVETTSHDIFLTLLSFGLSNNDEELPPFQTKIFEHLVDYLSNAQDTNTLDGYFTILRDNYFQYIFQVNNLLKYLVHNWHSKYSNLEKSKEKFLNFTKSILKINEELLEDKDEMHKKKLTTTALEVSCSTCEDFIRVIKGGSASRLATTESYSSSSVGIGRIIFTLALLAIIYYIFANDIQFNDIRDFVRDLRNQYKF